MKKQWSHYPRTKEPVIRLFRNIEAELEDGSRLYKRLPATREWDASGVLYWILANGTEEQHEEVNRMHEVLVAAKYSFPFATVIQEYLYKYDRKWIENNRRHFKFLLDKKREHPFG